MPYIAKENRDRLKIDRTPRDAGELNYSVTKLIDEYLRDKGLRYSTINEVVGVLECAKLELYRRVAAVYEDKKRNENGEVYTV